MGSPLPLGTQETSEGVNFSIFSRHASRVRLELFDHPEDAKAARIIELDPARHRTGDVWHVWVAGIPPGQLYAYRVDGPYEPAKGHRFNFNRLLLDPLATAISRLPAWDFASARGYDPSAPGKDLTLRHGTMRLDAEMRADRRALRLASGSTASTPLVEDRHLRGTCPGLHDSSELRRGSSGNLPWPHRKASLPQGPRSHRPRADARAGVQRRSCTRRNPQTGQPLKNYWGYDPVVFCAPKASYSSAGGLGQQKLEFKEMVRACHQAGIEVILDVVFNHTAEGNELGPTLCFRGIDNAIYYTLGDDRRHYRDYTGTGNSINANHPVVRDHILGALRYWMIEMHVDGFRFDLASVLGRGESGKLLANAPLLERIAEDPILRDVKLIAEAWDAAGAYQVGSFSGRRWAEWNGCYRDDVRRFWRGDEGMLGAFASRICGSADIYLKSGKGPEGSINFLTCHDGFTLNDLVSYCTKHNEANGENNRDGTDGNFSDNCGVEGATSRYRDRELAQASDQELPADAIHLARGADAARRGRVPSHTRRQQ